MRSCRSREHAAGGYAFESPPYGYRAEKGALVPDPEEQWVITRMRELRAEGMSLRAIATQLDVEGLRPRRAVR